MTRSLHGRNRLLALILVAVLVQVARNWILPRAAGVDASILDSIALLLALVTSARSRSGRASALPPAS